MQVKNKAGDVTNLSDAEQQMRAKNLWTQGIDPNAQAPQETWGTIVQPPVEAPVAPTVAPVTPVATPPTTPIAPTQPTVVPVASVPVAPVVEAPKIVPVKTTPKPVQSAQEVESNRLANEANQQSVNAQKEANVTAEFNQMLQSGASQADLVSFVNKNSQFKQQLNSSVRATFTNKANTKFFWQYNGVSNDTMYAAVKNWDVKVWSDQYNMLSEGQRNAFENFKKIKEAPSNIIITKEDAFNPKSAENSVDFSSIESIMAWLFSNDLRDKMNEQRNDTRVTDLEFKLEDLWADLNDFDIEGVTDIKALKDELWNAWNAPASIRAQVSDYNANRGIERMVKVNEYNRVQGQLSSVEKKLATDLEFYKFEDQQNKEKYQFALNMYESRRAEGIRVEERADDRAFEVEQTEEQRKFIIEQAQFLEDNKRLAVEKQQDYTTQLTNFQNNFAKEILGLNQEFSREETNMNQAFLKAMQQGDLVDDGEGNLVYVKDWKRVNMLSGLGKKIWGWVDWDFSFDSYQDKNSNYVSVIRNNDTGKVTTQVSDINGDIAGGYFSTLWNGKITSHGGAHDRYEWLDVDGEIGDPVFAPFSWKIVLSENDELYWNTIIVEDAETKERVRFSHLDSSIINTIWTEFEQGALIAAVWNSWNVIAWKWGDGSHLDIVSYDASGKVRDAWATEKYLKWLWAKANTQPWFSEDAKSWGENVLNWDAKISDLTGAENVRLKNEVSSYIAEKNKSKPNDNIVTLKSTLAIIQSLEDNKWLKAAVGAKWITNLIAGSKASWFKAKLEQLTAVNFMTGIQSMKWMGSLSDAEWQRVGASVSSISNRDQSEESFNAELLLMKQTIQNRISMTEKETWIKYDDFGYAVSTTPQTEVITPSTANNYAPTSSNFQYVPNANIDTGVDRLWGN